MSKKKKFMEEYIHQKNHTAPDLWDRINDGIDSERVPDYGALAGRPGKTAVWRPLSLAAAGLAVLFLGLSGMERASYDRDKSDQSFMETEAEAVLPYVDYRDLSLVHTSKVAVPERVAATQSQFYFSEDILADTELLCEATVIDVTFETDERGAAGAIVYHLKTAQVLYSQDYVDAKQVVTVKAELDENAVSDETILYALLKNRTYLLPLMSREDQYWLVFPFAPQIEVTQNQEYLFHNGWKSLVNQDALVVLAEQAGPEDFYFDRMYLRRDQNVIYELVSLTETMHQNGRNYYEKS